MTDVTSSFRGITTPAADLYAQIAQNGWETTSVKFDQGQDAFVAEAKNPYGERIVRTGPNDRTALGNLLIAITRRHNIRTTAQWKLGMWKTMFTDQLQPIAEAYAKAPVYDPKAAGYFMELAQDSTRRANVLREQLKIEVVDNPEPYANAQEMADDIHNKKHFYVSRANSQHPIWTVEQNVDFRIVHDVLGHAVSGGDFGWQGENLACFPGDTLVRTLDGYRPIESIKVGDKVLSANGEFNTVYSVMERDYDGEAISIETTSTTKEIIATPEHPFLKLKGNHGPDRIRPCMPGWCYEGRGIKNHTLEWTEASEIQEGDWVGFVSPIDHEVEISSVIVPDRHRGRERACDECRENRGKYGPCTHEAGYISGPIEFELTDDFLWAIGLYLAEGSSGVGSNQLIYSLHAEEKEFQNRLVSIFSNYGYGVAILPHGENGCEVQVRSAILSRWFSEWLGRGCENKAIPNELLNLSTNRLSHVVQGIFDGDGTKDRGQLGQTSEILALQVIEYAARIGLSPTVSSKQPENKKRVYTVDEIVSSNHRTRNSNKRGTWISGETNLRRVTKATKIYYTGKVFNLSVENDETYIVQNIAVHNCAAHFPLLTPTAQQALFTECLAQTAYAAFYRSFGPQKVALFPQFTEGPQAAENDPAHTGIHPSQSVAPTEMPAIPQSPPPEAHGAFPEGSVAPHEEGFGLTPVMNPPTFSKVAASAFIDPNAGWESGIAPMDPNAYLHHGDPLEADEVMDTASKIDTGWHSLEKPDGTLDRDRAKQAIVNAFRVVLLSPRKDLKWNAVHYQDIGEVPASVDDPKVYWDTLEKKRQAWNQAQGIDPLGHMVYYKFLKPFEAVIRAKNPDLSFKEAKEKAERTLFNWWSEEQERIIAEDEDKPEDKQKTVDEVERRANEALARRLKLYLKGKNDKTDKIESNPDQISLLGAQYNLLTGEEAEKYGAFIGTHLKSIAGISQHADDILDAALEDVENYGGTGYHFRAKVMQMGIKGVGPKVCSFAWLLLQPLTSQLATIDTHMLDVLGHKEKDMNKRDYFKFERELAAGRDAAGYGHIPLGAFQWGMWDHKRTGPGSHQDHSAMRVLNPIPHGNIDWASKAQNLKGELWHDQGPDWWVNTQPAREMVADQFDKSVAPGVPASAIPYQEVDPASIKKVGAELIDPYKKRMKDFTVKGLSTPEVWAQYPDEEEEEAPQRPQGGPLEPYDNPWAGFTEEAVAD